MERKPRSNQDAQDRSDAQRKSSGTVVEPWSARRGPNQGDRVLKHTLSFQAHESDLTSGDDEVFIGFV